jgi:hypothetical protein
MRHYALPGLCVGILLFALHTLTLASGISPALPVEPLEFVTADGARHAFRVHVAATPEERSRGLKYVTRMAPDQGMLFDFGAPRPVTMWMQHTPLSLDMVFVDAGGSVVRIEPRTTPFSTALIASGKEVLAVVELLAGTCARLDIRPGDRVEHRLFQPPAD